MDKLSLLARQFNLPLGKFSFPISYINAIAIVVLIFLLVLTLAQVRRHFVDWSFKGAVFGIIFGFLLALILEGFLIVSGRTVITGILGWKNAPKPISFVLDAGRNKLIQVLGVNDQTPTLVNENSGIQSVIQAIQSLNPVESKKIKTIICQ